MKRFKWVRVASFVAAVFILTACSSGGNSNGNTSGTTTITLWTWRTEDQTQMKQIFQGFSQQNPDVAVDLQAIPDTDYTNRLQVALRAGQGPDIAQMRPYGGLQPIIDGGYVAPLDDKVTELSKFSDDSKAPARGVKDKKIYGVPYSNPDLGVYYNTELFKQNGLDIPQTYSEFVAACQKLKTAGITPIAAGGANGTGWALEINLGVLGPNIQGPDFYNNMMNGSTTFNDPKYVATLQRFKDLSPYYSEGFAGVDYTTATQQFINGKAAMFFGGSWENGSFKSQNPNLHYSIFSFPPDVPTQPAYTSTFGDGSYALIASSTKQAAALKVLNFMASQQFEQQFADKLGWIPARTDVTPNDSVLKQMVSMSQHAVPYLTVVGFRWQDPTASSVLQPGLIDVVSGKTTPSNLAKATNDAVSQWFKPGTYR